MVQRIAQVVKAKNLREGDQVLVYDADGHPSWNRVLSCEPEYESGWYGVEFEGVKGTHDIEGRARVVVRR